jgi:GNAT superfamily N-acetyltransferase
VRELVIDDVPFDGALAQRLIDEVQQEYVARYGGPDETVVDAAEFAPPYGVFLVATVDGVPIGCAGLRRHTAEMVEIKRMFVRASHRRRGHARE